MKEPTMKYRQIVRVISETTWAILPSTLAVILEIVEMRTAGERFTDEEIQERISGGPQPRRQARTVGAVAVLPLQGVLAPRAALVNNVSSPNGTGMDAFKVMLRSAVDDPDIGSILIDVNSPGGSVDQIPEMAAEIRAARGSKPIVALANGMAASAAYWLASQADEIVVTPSGSVGSIGVYGAHEDISGMLEKEGIKTTLISAGKYKTELSPFGPLSDEARAAAQERVNTFFSMFVGDIAKGRGVPADQVRGGFGEGRMMLAKAAVKEGMADRVATFDETVARLARGGGTSTKARAETQSGTGIADTREKLYTLDQAREALALALAEKPDPVDDADEVVDDTDSTDSSTLVPGAERLLSRRSFRDAIAQ
jgi:capsid assembly protease